MSIDYPKGLRMAQAMKEHDAEIRKAIRRCEKKQHGVVALMFTNECRDLKIEILDAPYEGNVRVYPG